MRKKLLGLALAVFVFNSCLRADDSPDSALNKADKLSSLTGHGATPFHLRIMVAEAGNSSSTYQATIEEFWLSPTHWSRTVATGEFKQAIYVDGDQRQEQTTGNYSPLWLRNFVTAAIDPLENKAFWEK